MLHSLIPIKSKKEIANELKIFSLVTCDIITITKIQYALDSNSIDCTIISCSFLFYKP